MFLKNRILDKILLRKSENMETYKILKQEIERDFTKKNSKSHFSDDVLNVLLDIFFGVYVHFSSPEKHRNLTAYY